MVVAEPRKTAPPHESLSTWQMIFHALFREEKGGGATELLLVLRQATVAAAAAVTDVRNV